MPSTGPLFQSPTTGMSPRVPYANGVMSAGPPEFELRRYHVSRSGLATAVNQFDRRPHSDWNAEPVRVTEPDDPTICIDRTRPPKSPRPLRDENTKPWNVPMP